MIRASLSAGATFVGATGRGSVLVILTEADPDDKVKIRGFLSWVEDFVFGIRYLFYESLAAFIVILAFLGVLQLLRMGHESKLEDSKDTRSRPNVITAKRA